ncbi:metal ABC transporter ATP-binding protein [Corynebacterium ulceribovis]|uniref:metal ABC transporter ATP-binding protein n=1 Tax=Corynebacterium ulceribovis TaxID=487732 RepID=UPI00038169D2
MLMHKPSSVMRARNWIALTRAAAHQGAKRARREATATAPAAAPATESATPLVTADNATLGYGAKHVVSGVTFSLHPGEALALVGPNGSGKTTFLRALTGSAEVQAGSLDFLGVNRLARRTYVPPGAIGYVPQQSDLDLSFPIVVRQVVEQGLHAQSRWFGALRPGARTRVAAALDRVGMRHTAELPFGQLSGGQRQRILLARAIVAQPALVLLDEPFNGLDEPNRNALLGIIHSIKADGIGVIVVTHDLRLARETCDNVALFAGRQIACGPIESTLTDENLAVTFGMTHVG